MTEAGAISATAAFFRQELDACAWVDGGSPTTTCMSNDANIHHINNSTAVVDASPTRLAFQLNTTRCNDERASAVRMCKRLELVVSRAAGPPFSALESVLAAQAATLLRQALFRVNVRRLLKETEVALEGSFRGMEEASAAVAALVGERDELVVRGEKWQQTEVLTKENEKRALRREAEAEAEADCKTAHERVVKVGQGEFERFRAESMALRRRLSQVEKSAETVLSVASRLCFVAAGLARDATQMGGSDAAGDEAIVPDEHVEEAELVGLVKNVARSALSHSSARVDVDGADVSRTVDAKPETYVQASTRTPSERNSVASTPSGGEDEGAERAGSEGGNFEEEFRVPVPHCENRAVPLTLVVRSRRDSKALSEQDKALALGLADCLGPALFAVRQKHRLRKAELRQAGAERMARKERGVVANSSATVDAPALDPAKSKGDAVAGETFLAAAGVAAIPAQATAGDNAGVLRAKRQTKALLHLLSALSATKDHVDVARVVAEGAVGAVPACIGVVLLAIRRSGGRDGPSRDSGGHRGGGDGRVDNERLNRSVAECRSSQTENLSPDPRVWASTALINEHGSRRRSHVDERRGRRWVATVGNAAAQAAASRKAVCLRDASCGESDRIICFSPVLATSLYASRSRRDVRSCSDSAECVESRGKERGTVDVAGVLAITLRFHASSVDGELSELSTSFAGAMGSTSPKLPSVSRAIVGISDAVGLALTAVAMANTGITSAVPVVENLSQKLGDTSSTRVVTTCAADGVRIMNSVCKSRELKRLRNGTSALAERVKTLERRAGGLRDSEARTSAALARARADAMAVRGQLQLAAIERDRLLRRLDDRIEGGDAIFKDRQLAYSGAGSRSDEAQVRVLGIRENSDGLIGGLVGLRLQQNPPSRKRVLFSGSNAASINSQDNKENERYSSGGWVSSMKNNTRTSVTTGIGVCWGNKPSETGEREAMGRRVDATAVAAEDGGFKFRSASSPVGDGGSGGGNSVAVTPASSSEALQRMASVHARLSASLRGLHG